MMDPYGQSSRTPKRGFKRWEKAGIRYLRGSEIYDEAFGLYRRNGLQLLRLLAIPASLAYGLLLLSWEFVGRRLFFTGSTNGGSLQEAGEVAGLLFFGTLCAAPLVLLAYSYMSAAATLYMSDVHLGRYPNIASIHREVMKRLISLAALNFLLLVVVVGVGLIGVVFLFLSALVDEASGGRDIYAGSVALFGVVGIISGLVLFPIFLAKYALAPVAMLVEGIGPLQALKRSAQLTSSRQQIFFAGSFEDASPGGKIFGLFLLTVLLQLLLWSSLQIPATVLQNYLLSQGVAETSVITKSLYVALSLFGGFASFILTHPFFVAGIALVYFNRRVAVEALDIELLAQDIWKNDRAVEFDL